jgi:hypothetical protein
MKKIGVIIALLVIISLLLVPLAACQGEFGAGKQAGQLVVCDTDFFAICHATTCDQLYFFGSGFPPGTCVTITICDMNYVLYQIGANDCGAFISEGIIIIDTLDPEQYSYLSENYNCDAVSIRAWLTCRIVEGKIVDGELWASWPLRLCCLETCPE